MTVLDVMSTPCEDRDFSAWHQGCAWAAVWVVMLNEPLVNEALALARTRLGPALLPRYQRQPHLSVAYRGLCQQGGHPAQEFDEEALRADIARLQQLRLAPFNLQLAGANSFETVPYLAVQTDAGEAELHALHHALSPSTPRSNDEQIAAEPYPAWRYVPHLTVGHYAQSLPLSEAVQRMALADWRSPPMPITQLALVRYASADMAGPLITEAVFDLRTACYQSSRHAIWPDAGKSQTVSR